MSPSTRQGDSRRLDRFDVVRTLLACLLLVMYVPPGLAFAQPDGAAVADAAHAEEESHEGSGLVDLVARLVNFGVLAGLVMYVARSPMMRYLGDRRDRLRSDLVGAAQMRKTANEQIAEIDRRLGRLPGELETLKAQGVLEIAAEEARIAKAAEAERERLLEQTRRELDQQVRIARDDLRATVAELATSIARTRISESITPADQDRLMTRYLAQLDEAEGRS